MEGKVKFEFQEVKQKLLEGGSGGRGDKRKRGKGEKVMADNAGDLRQGSLVFAPFLLFSQSPFPV